MKNCILIICMFVCLVFHWLFKVGDELHVNKKVTMIVSMKYSTEVTGFSGVFESIVCNVFGLCKLDRKSGTINESLPPLPLE